MIMKCMVCSLCHPIQSHKCNRENIETHSVNLLELSTVYNTVDLVLLLDL